ncbi:MAG: hypothetical protein FD141_589 [Fusobacteria bacterium]|nr:MAG: hypothetical protein FD141_589 [Fusobacteriota bacterium]KAF0228745.1 MAG: hypothetical protein FD182_1001 [Fusobacteriota bacterium]
MLSKDEIKSLFIEYGHIMKTSELNDNKISYRNIKELINNGVIEKLRNGYYHLADENDFSEIKIINLFYHEAIICMNSALYYHGYSDRTPSEWHLATYYKQIKINYPFIKLYLLEKSKYEIGKTDICIDGHKSQIYDKERTICDCLRHLNKMDREIFNKAIQNYVKDQKKNIPNLMKYAKQLKLEKKVKDLLSIWI